MITTKQMRYLEAAEEWTDCLPLGNGFIAGMLNGNITSEEIFLNEDSFWYGGARDRNNPDAAKYLDEIRRLVFEEKMEEATELGIMALAGTPESQRHYLPAGKLLIKTKHEECENYCRELDLSTAVASLSYTTHGVDYKRTYFTSNPANVMVVQFTANAKNSLNLVFDYGRERYVDTVTAYNNNSVLRRSYSGAEDGVTLTNLISATSKDGVIKTIGQNLVVEGASEVTLYIAMATTYRHENPQAYCEQIIHSAIAKGYETLLDEHIADYTKLFNTLNLSISNNNTFPSTKAMLENADSNEATNALIETYFNFGRYLLISCSREGSLPATLQGIWNDRYLPPWDSKYTININTEMNYWPAELLNLSSCHLPLFDHLRKMEKNGRKTADVMYGARGFCAHHNTDIWADTAPQDRTKSSTIWALGAAWFCIHVIDRFDFTCDYDFAKSNYDLLKAACEFILDYQVLHNNMYVTVPSISPENTYILESGKRAQITYSCAMDTQIICTLFNGTIRVAEAIGADEAFCNTLKARMEQMPKPVNISQDGRIMEWVKDYEEHLKGHRHVSHLFALYPSNLIGDDEQKLAAARKSLETRLENGGGGTGWSLAWIINFWARLKDGDNVLNSIVRLLQKSTYTNLFDRHPPFQIDGNFGAVAGIGEALIQSHNSYIEILPALPTLWKNGSIEGICARGNLEFSIYWQDNVATKIHIVSKDSTPKTIELRYGDVSKTIEIIDTITLNQELNII